MQPIPDSLLTPAMRQLLEKIRRAGRPALHTLSVKDARALYHSAAEVLDFPRRPLGRVEDRSIGLPNGIQLDCRLYAVDDSAQRPGLLYLHGGGFTIGGLETHDSLCRQIAWRSGWTVVSLDYRLAPEHRFPTAQEDVWGALQWLYLHGATWGISQQTWAVGGDSAGATLAAVCALQARDANLPLAAQILITPGTAPTTDSQLHQKFGQGFLLEHPTIEWFFGHYIDDTSRHDWRYAPLVAPDHAGVAPAYLVLAECDPLLDEGIAYADCLRTAAVPVDLYLAKGVTHDFIKMGRALPEAEAGLLGIGEFLRNL
jgi:acetyl esterase